MRIALLTEGSYPHSHGGVSVWCDQLTSGLPEYEFEVHAVVASGAESVVWEPPANVVGVTLSPLWGTPPKQSCSRQRSKIFLQSFGDLLDAMMTPAATDVEAFGTALRALLPFATAQQLPRLLKSPKMIEFLLDRWRLRPAPGRALTEASNVPAPTVSDAVTAIDLLDHLLRPLGSKVPDADLCHAVSNGVACLIAFNAKWTKGIPFLLTEHGLYLRERYLEYRVSDYSLAVRALIMRFLRLLTSASYQMADFITPGSEYNRRWAVRLGAAEANVRPVYNGVDPAAFPDAAEPDQPILSWVGRVAPIKDVENLITAFGLVHQEIPDAKLRLFGSAPAGNETYLQSCRKLIEELGLAQHATFEGRVEDVADAYHAGQVVVLSSASEGFPYTVIEAMTSGRTTVSTDVGGVREAVGDTGAVVPARDPEAFAAACVSMLTDHDRRHQLATASRARALQHFTLAQFLKTYREIYPALAARQAPRHTAQSVADETVSPLASTAALEVSFDAGTADRPLETNRA